MLTEEHLQQLHSAKRALEAQPLVMRIANLIGTPIEAAVDALPPEWQQGIVGVTRKALEAATEAALWTTRFNHPAVTGDVFHSIAVTVTGAAAGLFGLPALTIELPLSTAIMMRSIAEIARSEGEDLSLEETKMECISVFALGSPSSADDAIESSYYLVRVGLAKMVSEAAQYAAKSGGQMAAPAMVQFITIVANRFSIQVTQKVAAQAAPIVGAAGGALINNLFISHFQDVGRGHFQVRRLERIYSPEAVKAAYERLPI